MDSNRIDRFSIYHVNCEILISQGNNRCNIYKKHRKPLCALASRHNKSKQADACNSDHTSGASGTGEFLNHIDSTETGQPLDLSPCLPTESCTELTVFDNIMELHDGLKGHGDIPSGMEK